MNRQHLETILWLRWRLTRNQWARGGGLGAAIAVAIGVGSVALSALFFCGALAASAWGLRRASPQVIQVVWWSATCVFLLFWMIGVIAELQRSESIDLQKLLHLPVSLPPMFLVNYVASHLTLSMVTLVPGMLGLALGSAWARGPAMLLLIPLVLSMVFMVTAWTYRVRGWLASMISNPRKRRTVVVGLTFGVVLLGQLPNLYFNVINPIGSTAPQGATREQRRAADRADEARVLQSLDRAERWIAPLWLPGGAHALAKGRTLPALLGTLGCLLLGGLGLAAAYRGTVRQFMGESGERAPGPTELSAAIPARAAGELLVERAVRGVPEQASALAAATLQSMLRAPEVQMLWGTTFLVTLILAATFLVRGSPHVPEAVRPLVVTGALSFSVFLQVQCFANPFGFDREGFRALVLSPVDRRLILLGKNLAFLPVGMLLGALLLCGGAYCLKLGGAAVVTLVFQLATMLLIAAMAGNLLAILSPYRVASGSLKPTKMPARAMLVLIACQLFFPLTLSPAFAPPLVQLAWSWLGGPPAVPIGLLLSILMAGAAVALYRLTLPPMGRLLQRRETQVLRAVTAEVE